MTSLAVLTPAAERALSVARGWVLDAAGEVSAPAVLLGLLAESECRAAVLLQEQGIDPHAVRQQWPDLVAGDRQTIDETPLSLEVEAALAEAQRYLAGYPRPAALATEHILAGLIAVGRATGEWLAARGLDANVIAQEFHKLAGYCDEPLELPPGESPADAALADAVLAEAAAAEAAAEQDRAERPYSPAPAVLLSPNSQEAVRLLRVVDAAANRAREGLRVVEDYVRFALDDTWLTRQLKELRHDVAGTLSSVKALDLIACRDTLHDVGASITTPAEGIRRGAEDILIANFRRAQEALRTLEEFGKRLAPQIVLTPLRYRAYVLERAVHATAFGQARLDQARLYVLADGKKSAEDFQHLLAALIRAGVHAIQLRDKNLSDGDLLARANQLRIATRGSRTLCFINDRADIAAASHADGIHLGQEDLPLAAVRRAVGPRMLIGISTHSLDQARRAVLDGANYIGVGPCFPSHTKTFEQFPGLDLVRQVSQELSTPAFAIGGIHVESIPQLRRAGASRIAVGAAITAAADPGAAAAAILRALAL